MKLKSLRHSIAHPGILGMALLLVVSMAQAQDSNPWIKLGKQEAHPTRILARLSPNHDLSDLQNSSLLEELGLSIRNQYKLVPGLIALEVASSPRALQAVVPPPDPDLQASQLLSRIASLRDSGLFLYVQPSYVKRLARDPNDARYVDGTLWGLRNIGVQSGVIGADIGARQAWDITTGSTNVIVAVLDTGIRYTHQDLAGNMWRNPAESANGEDDDGNGYVDDIFGVNVIEGTGDPMDFDEHGTHVAGTIGATADDGFPHVGVSWNVRLMAVRWITSAGGTTDNELLALEYAVANGAHIMNGSYLGYGFDQAQFDAVLAARQAGVLFVAAAGNDANDNDLFSGYPASLELDNVISVVALDRRDRLASFSNFGLRSADVGAPGVDIFSTVSLGNASYDGTFSGTSMASPHVAGVAALILARYTNAPLPELRERILQTAVPVSGLAGRTVTGGRVNAHKALVAEPDGVLEVTVDPPSGALLLAGDDQVIEVRVTDLFSITDATVTGVIQSHGITIDFLNDGQDPDDLEGDNVYTGTLSVPTDATSITLEITVETSNAVAFVIVTYNIQPPPPNDHFVNALKIPPAGARIASNNRLATIEPNEPFHADVPSVAATLWWTWSPASDTPVLIDTAGSSFDTVIAVYTGNSLLTLTEIAAVDDVDDRLAGYVTFDARAAVTYRIVIGGYDSSQTGDLQLRVEPNGQPDLVPPSVAFTTPSGFISTDENLVVKGIAFDPQPNASGVREVLVRINDELIGRSAVGTTNWSAPFQLREGLNTVTARAVDFAGNVGAPQSITVTYMPQDPLNDHFANAAILEGSTATAIVNTTRATKEHNEPNHGGNDGGRSVWYRWTAPGEGSVSLTTLGSDFDTLLGVYTGDRVGSLTLVASNDDDPGGGSHSAVTFAARADVTYHVAIDGYGGVSGMAHLEMNFTTSPVFALTIEAGPGGSVRPGSGDYPGAPLDITAIPDPGFEFDGWSGGITSDLNPLTITPDSDLTLTASFRLETFTEDFETGGFKADLDWNRNPNGSSAPWAVQGDQVAGGKFAARSGSTRHGQHSAVTLSISLDAGVGSFAYRVSSETSFDKLEFYVDGILESQWSGQVAWATHEFSIPTNGVYELEWRYSKDFTINAGDDAAFVDNIWLPLASETPEPASLKLSYLIGEPKLELRGLPNRLYVLQVSSDLQSWRSISTNLTVNGVIQISDPEAARQSTRFYRAVKP